MSKNKSGPARPQNRPESPNDDRILTRTSEAKQGFRPISDGQRMLLWDLGVADADIPRSRGQASNLINKLLNARRRQVRSGGG